VNKQLYDKVIELPEEMLTHLSKCFNAVPDSNANDEGHNRNQEIVGSGAVTYQQLQRIDNWFRTFNGRKQDAPYILNGGDLMRNWVTQKLGELRNGVNTTQQVRDDHMPEDVNDELIDDMGWLANMNRSSKEHKGEVDDLKITESLKRINEIIKKII
jgi:hypothetical protein